MPGVVRDWNGSEKLWLPHPGIVQGQAGQYLEHPGLVEGGPAMEGD